MNLPRKSKVPATMEKWLVDVAASCCVKTCCEFHRITAELAERRCGSFLKLLRASRRRNSSNFTEEVPKVPELAATSAAHPGSVENFPEESAGRNIQQLPRRAAKAGV
jgi:hypothetical protein